MTDELNLLSCPFCNTADTISVGNTRVEDHVVFEVYCSACTASVYDDLEEVAIAKWNNRGTPWVNTEVSDEE